MLVKLSCARILEAKGSTELGLNITFPSKEQQADPGRCAIWIKLEVVPPLQGRQWCECELFENGYSLEKASWDNLVVKQSRLAWQTSGMTMRWCRAGNIWLASGVSYRNVREEGSEIVMASPITEYDSCPPDPHVRATSVTLALSPWEKNDNRIAAFHDLLLWIYSIKNGRVLVHSMTASWQRHKQ